MTKATAAQRTNQKNWIIFHSAAKSSTGTGVGLFSAAWEPQDLCQGGDLLFSMEPQLALPSCYPVIFRHSEQCLFPYGGPVVLFNAAILGRLKVPYRRHLRCLPSSVFPPCCVFFFFGGCRAYPYTLPPLTQRRMRTCTYQMLYLYAATAGWPSGKAERNRTTLINVLMTYFCVGSPHCSLVAPPTPILAFLE